MRPGDRLLVAFTKPIPIGTQFSEWILHVTVVPWFRLGAPSQAIAVALTEDLEDIAPFVAVVGEEDHFGHGHRKLVNLIELPTSFQVIEARCREYLHDEQAWIVDETTSRRYDYRPHITAQTSGRVKQGDTFKCDRLYIVEQKGEYKEVTSIITLNDA